MAGPKYQVGIEFVVKGNLNTLLTVLNKKMKTLANNAKEVNTAFASSLASMSKIEAQQVSSSVKLARDAAREKIRIKHYEVRTNNRTAALQEQLDHKRSTRALATEARISRARKASMGTLSSAARSISSIGGGFGGGFIGSLISASSNPLVLGASVVLAALVASTEGANTYAKALLNIESTGLSAAEAQKKLASVLNTTDINMKRMSVGGRAGVIGNISTYLHFAKDTKSLQSTYTAGGRYLRDVYGEEEKDAIGTMGGLTDALRMALAQSGITDQSKQAAIIPGLLSRGLGIASNMGDRGPGYLSTMEEVMRNPSVVSAVGAAHLPNLQSAIAVDVAGGMTAKDIIQSINLARGGLDKGTVVQLLAAGQQIGIGGIQSVIGKRGFGLQDPRARQELLLNPRGFVEDFLLPQLTKKSPKQLETDEVGMRDVVNKGEQYYGKIEGGIFAKMISAYASTPSAEAALVSTPNANWDKMLNPVVDAMDLLRGSMGVLTTAIMGTWGYKAVEVTAHVADFATNQINAPVKKHSLAHLFGTDEFTSGGPTSSGGRSFAHLFGTDKPIFRTDTPLPELHTSERPAGASVTNHNVLNFYGHDMSKIKNALRNATNPGGTENSTYLTGH